jgi:hypothetical protein
MAEPGRRKPAVPLQTHSRILSSGNEAYREAAREPMKRGRRLRGVRRVATTLTLEAFGDGIA